MGITGIIGLMVKQLFKVITMKILFSTKSSALDKWRKGFTCCIWGHMFTPTDIQELSAQLLNGAEVWVAADKKSDPVKVDFEGDFSVESILWHLCGMIYPQSAYLSRQCVKTLDARDKGEISDMEALEKFTAWIDSSVCEVQKEVLRGIVERFILGLSEGVKSNG